MKNFLELLDTDLKLSVVINNLEHVMSLHDHLEFDADHVVTVDNIEVLPKYAYLAVNSKLTINEPFYCWYHWASGQGWLLIPH